MTDHNSGIYAQQIAEPFRAIDPNLWARDGRYSVPPFTVDAAENDNLILIRVPANTLFIPSQAVLYTTALGGSTTADVGWLANDAIELTADPNGLADGLDVSTAGNHNPFALKNVAAEAFKPFWAWCGLSADPGDGHEIVLAVQLVDANPAEGTFSAFLPVRDRG